MNNFESIHRFKIRVITFLMLLFVAGIILMLGRWQLVDSERFIAIANERYRDVKIPALRGNILARDGTSLAYSEPRFDVYVWVPELQAAEKRGYQSEDEFIAIVSDILGADNMDIRRRLEDGRLWVKIADKITLEVRDKLINTQIPGTSRHLQGLQVEYVNKRVYPEERLASQVLGFVGSNTNGEYVGVGGIEQYWEGSLKPQEGFESGEFDGFGNPITISDNTPLEPKPGVTVHTTIDKTLQGILEQKLEEGLTAYKAQSATGIIMDPSTGAVLAMANFPDFNPNFYFLETDGTVFGNKAINTPYEIGSVGKVFTLSSAFDLNTLEPESVVLPEGHEGCEIIQPSPPPDSSCQEKDPKKKVDCICTYDRKPNHTRLTAAQAFINSDNIGFRHIALTMSYQEFYSYLRSFGVSQNSGIELAGESTGILTAAEDWNYADQSVFSYGHGYQMTPIQVISGVATIANEGKRMQPYIVSKVEAADGTVKSFNPRVVAEVVKPITAETVKEIMYEVFKNTLIEREYKGLSKYYIALKSGTALIPYTDRPGYSDEINATYVGFDASPDKKFIMLIKLEKPDIGELSFSNARKLWLDTFIAIKDYLGIREYYK